MSEGRVGSEGKVGSEGEAAAPAKHAQAAAAENLPDTLQTLAPFLARYAEREAIVFFRREGDERWSYRQLAEAAGRLASGIAALGLSAGDRVAICAPNRPAWIIAMLAVFRAGAVVVPLDTQQAALAHVLHDSAPRLIFASASEAGVIRAACPDLPFTLVLLEDEDEAAGASWTRLSQPSDATFSTVGAEDVAVLFYTSGTTGAPKGVPLSHANLLFQLRTLAASGIVSADDRVLLPLPLHHVYPLVVGMLTTLVLGLPLILPSAFTGVQVQEAMRHGQATVMIGVPRLYQAMLDGIEARLRAGGRVGWVLVRAAIALSAFLRRRLGSRLGATLLRGLRARIAPDLRIVVSGGAALKPESAWRLEALGWTVATGYGLTETSPMLTINPPGSLRFESAGHPVPGTSLRIGERTAREPEAGRPDGVPGEVEARGPGVFRGYHQLPQKTAEAFTEDGWFRTGDLGWIDGRGDLHLSGRGSTLIVTPEGKKVQPDDLEDAYQAHPAIREIAVLQRDNRLVGLVVPQLREGADTPEAAEAMVRAAVAEISRTLPPYRRLAEVAVTRDAIPRTRLGKPRRHLLAARFEEALRQRGGAPPRKGSLPLADMSGEDRALLDDPSARAAWEWLETRFPDRWLSPDSDLRLDLGVDSMQWLDLSLGLFEQTGVDLDEGAIARVSTIRDLLTEVARQGTGPGRARLSLDDPEAALSPADRRWLTPPGPVAAAAAWVLYWLNRILMRTLFRVRCEGRDLLPHAGPFVIAPNHASYLDPPAIAAVLPYARLRGVYWAGAQEVVFSGPLRRQLARLGQAVPIDTTKAAAASLAFGAAVLRRNRGLVWFPEGRRTPDGQLQPFRPGLGILLDHDPVPVLPVWIDGTYAAWPPGRWPRRLVAIRIRFAPPVSPDELERQGQGETRAQRILDALHTRLQEIGGVGE